MQSGALPSIVLAVMTLVAIWAGAWFLVVDDRLDRGGGTTAILRASVPLLECQTEGGCRRVSSRLRDAYGTEGRCEGTGRRVCLVPMGDIPLDLVDHLVAYYREEYDLTLNVMSPVDLPSGFDRPGQLEVAETRLFMMNESNFKFTGDANLVLIGLLPLDVYIEDRATWNWSFGSTFSIRIGPEVSRQAIISTFRMDPRSHGEPQDKELEYERVRKMLNKYIALLYYDLGLSGDPTSVTYHSIGGLRDLDRIDEAIPLKR